MVIPYEHFIQWFPREGFANDKYAGFVVVCFNSDQVHIPESMHELSDDEVQALINQSNEMCKEGIIPKEKGSNKIRRVLEGFLLRRREENAYIWGQIGITTSSDVVDDLITQWNFKEWKEWDI